MNSNNPPSDEMPVEHGLPIEHDEDAAAETTETSQADVTSPHSETDSTESPSEEDTASVEASAEDEYDTIVILTRQGKNPNAEMLANPSRPLTGKDTFREGEELYVLPCTAPEFNRIMEQIRRVDPTGSELGQHWKTAVSQSGEVLPRADLGLDALMRNASLWRQAVRTGGEGSKELQAHRPGVTDRTGERQLRGEEALHHLQMMLGRGQITRVPLWHSGIWVTFKAPTESQLLELDRRIANEKIALGRSTNGLGYSNMSVYHNSFLFNFALAMVIDCSISGYTIESLKKKILLPDMPLLLWGLLCTIYPNGYRYHRPCISDPSVCIHVTEELLDITRLCWTDNSELNEAQRKHMVRKTAKFPDVELANYVAHHSASAYKTILGKDNGGNKTTIELRVPTLADYEASGFAWIEGIVTSADDAFGSQLGGNARNEYILDQAKITSLRQYAHWIERVTFSDGKYIEDRPTLENLVGQLTGDKTVSENLLEGVKNFINSSTISQIAIPAYKCPHCQADQQDPEEVKHPHLIPLDIGTIFFILLGQRTLLILDEAVV